MCSVFIDSVTLEEAAEVALRSPQTAIVYTPNATMLERCGKEERLAELLNRATLSLPDGMGVVWKARALGTPLRSRVAGIDFGERLLACAAEQDLGVYLLGGKEGVALRACQRLCSLFPRLRICGYHSGYFSLAFLST